MALAFVIASVLPALGSASVPEDLFSEVTTLIVPYSAHPNVDIDGTISAREYDANVTFTTSDTDVSISLLHDNRSLYVGIEGPSWSWVAFGVSTNNATSMGFVVIAKTGSGYQVQERLVSNVTEDMNLLSVTGEPALEDVGLTTMSNSTVVELQLSLESRLWDLHPGIVFPAVFATNLTAPAGFPNRLSGPDVHFMGIYLLRPGDNVNNVNELLNGTTSAVPSSVALFLLVVGIGTIVFVFIVRRRKA